MNLAWNGGYAMWIEVQPRAFSAFEKQPEPGHFLQTKGIEKQTSLAIQRIDKEH